MSEATLKKYIEYYETLSPQSLGDLRKLASNDLYFKDPFNQVTGIDKVERILAHMFETTDEPVFVVEQFYYKDNSAFLKWKFDCKTKAGKSMQIIGATELIFNEQGLVSKHIDYWDAAEQLYEHIPLLGSILRFVKKKIEA